MQRNLCSKPHWILTKEVDYIDNLKTMMNTTRTNKTLSHRTKENSNQSSSKTINGMWSVSNETLDIIVDSCFRYRLNESKRTKNCYPVLSGIQRRNGVNNGNSEKWVVTYCVHEHQTYFFAPCRSVSSQIFSSISVFLSSLSFEFHWDATWNRNQW